MTDWLFEDELTFGGTESRVGLVTLWTHQKHYDDIDRDLFHVMGNLYSQDGVNYIARNLLAHPQIRSLIVCGSDGILEDTGVTDALLGWRVIDAMIPDEEVSWLRRHVRLRRCGRETLAAELRQENAALDEMALPQKEPAVYPLKREGVATFPSEISGMRVVWSSIYEAWIDALGHVLRFGLSEGKRRYLLNLVSVIDGDGGPLPSHVSPDRAREYAAKFLSPERDDDVTYTYGSRLLNWGDGREAKENTAGMNLVELAVAKLERDPLSSQCLIDLWDNRVDVRSEEPPCLTQIALNLVDGDMYLTGFFRSHDLYRAYFLNLYALRQMQRELAERLGAGLGKLTTISTHAHIYQWDLEPAGRAVEEADRPTCVWDPRGNVAITRRDGKLVAILYSPDGERLHEYEARGRQRLLSDLVKDNALSQPSHYVYVTKELYQDDPQ